MKLSMYNIETKTKDGLLIFNTVTSGILLLNEEYTLEYEKLKIDDGKCQKDDLIKEMIRCGMLVDDSTEELSKVIVENNVNKYAHNIDFTIATTMNCNFACPYCYEEGVRYNTMTKKIADKTIRFILEQTTSNTPLSIYWYGGEPLLDMKTLTYITKELQKNKDKFASYSASIVTNGYLLTEKVAKQLKKLNIENVQITLDGPAYIHNKRRYLKASKKPTFETILNNIKQCCEILNISLRVNVDKSNMECVDELFQTLCEKGLKDKVSFYISPVSDFSENPNKQCFSNQEFSKEQVDFYLRMIEKGNKIVSVPHANYGVCSAISPFSFLVDPLGDLYKCWNDVSRKDLCVGNVETGVQYNEVLSKHLNYEPIKEKKCFKCSILPLCLGGCPNENMVLKKTNCSPLKFNVSNIVEYYYKSQLI